MTPRLSSTLLATFQGIRESKGSAAEEEKRFAANLGAVAALKRFVPAKRLLKHRRSSLDFALCPIRNKSFENWCQQFDSWCQK